MAFLVTLPTTGVHSRSTSDVAIPLNNVASVAVGYCGYVHVNLKDGDYFCVSGTLSDVVDRINEASR